MDMLKRGAQVGPYVILQAVPGGVGGMATVYKAQLGKQGPIVALKVAHQGMGDFLKDEGAFLRARQLAHPNIIKILPTPLTDGSEEYIVKDARTGCWYFAMEFMEGGDLDQWMQVRKQLTIREALEITEQTGKALDAAHQAGVLHLDVKPSNILFRKDPRSNGHTANIVLSDFGIARPEGRIASGQTMTVEYASPEQARRAQGEPLAVGKAADLYSLAVIFYELLSGKLPFQAENDTALLHHIVYERPDWDIEVTPELVAVLERALAKDPEERYSSAAELIRDIRANIPEEVLREKIPSMPVHAGKRGFSPLLALGLGIVIGLGLGAPAGYQAANSGWVAGPSPVVTPTPETLSQPSPTLPSVIDRPTATAIPTSELPVSEPEETPETVRVPTSTPLPATPTFTPRPILPTPVPEDG